MFEYKKKFSKFVSILMLFCLVIFGSTLSEVQANEKISSFSGQPAAVSLATNAIAVSQVSSLNGTVVADGLVKVGTPVKEGQILVMVKTFAGNAPAVRASVDGTVIEVMVVPGSEITAGQVVVKIKPY